MLTGRQKRPIDLDSMSCSVLYAYLRSLSPPRNAFSPVYVPIANIPSSDIQLRPEYLAVFRHADIEAKHLITLTDLPDLAVIESKLRPENTRWILVDHNALQGQLGNIYSGRVGGVIDHHDEEGKVPHDTGDEPRIVERSGSCTSLVTEYCQQAWDQLSDSALAASSSSGASHSQGESLQGDGDGAAVTALWDAQVAQLGLASILIDTNNLQSKDKTTSHDSAAVEYLEAKIQSCPTLAPQYERGKFYGEIDTAKKDIGSLQLRDILRKDYKEWDKEGLKLGVSSVVKPIGFLEGKARDEKADTQSLDTAFYEALRAFRDERELDLYTVMTTSTSSTGEFQRELLLWAFGEEAVAAAERFASDAKEELGLEEWSRPADDSQRSELSAPLSPPAAVQERNEWRRVWWQRNVQHSRKRVAPLLREAMAA
ncbi:exopolyphosphatase-like protein [Aaosphaeria arxii CBS 175.79]|uniref:Exopolyphosphatase-like protein n=1 Tax=Aaosphaeria arxii CBS 175.79 TaxID=1450172 RepID=A0A6A5Y8T5_9PLEO|nr:exopolyphosphatase-like protein [Aaosphaeria arxii CBS 175.79]KAF2021230.1 exopolyphosphatase-like protein [Aaosphaeria arxii CBS 175.79]